MTDALLGHLLTAIVIGGAIAGVYARLSAQIAVLQTEIRHLRERPAVDPEAHATYCEKFCPVRQKVKDLDGEVEELADEWREISKVQPIGGGG